MPHRFEFDGSILNSVVGGQSALEMRRLALHSEDAASSFVRAYGFDLSQPEQEEKLWYYHRRALVLMEEKLGVPVFEIPIMIRERKQLKDLRKLLLWASSTLPEERRLQRWACAVLRVMHVFVHTENDLFASFSEEIQNQILSPFEKCIFQDSTSGRTFIGKCQSATLRHEEPLSLLGFEVKPFKNSSSTVIKLLAKPDSFALNVFDKLGVRFITHSIFDTFRLIRFLVEENLISFPHIMPEQSSNNLYPVDLFLEICEDLKIRTNSKSYRRAGVGNLNNPILEENMALSNENIEALLKAQFEEKKDKLKLLRKENFFSGHDYRFIKFIARRFITLKTDSHKAGFSFFFPYEVQIMDQEAHEKILSGPSEHHAYKQRQRDAARKRVIPDEEFN